MRCLQTLLLFSSGFSDSSKRAAYIHWMWYASLLMWSARGSENPLALWLGDGSLGNSSRWCMGEEGFMQVLIVAACCCLLRNGRGHALCRQQSWGALWELLLAGDATSTCSKGAWTTSAWTNAAMWWWFGFYFSQCECTKGWNEPPAMKTWSVFKAMQKWTELSLY